MHVGYCISCYGEETHVFSAPISATRMEARKILSREFIINGEPLSKMQLEGLRPFLIGDIEIGWDDTLEFLLEGHNLPDDDQ